MTASTERASPLAAWSERLARASAVPGAFSIRELAFTTQINVRGDPLDAAFRSATRDLLACELPTAPNTFTAGSQAAAIWLGPDEWLIVAAPGRGDELAGALRQALTGSHVSVTDVSAARTVVEIAGSDARLVLAKGCPLDVHASAFGPPRAAQTLLAKTRAIIQCADGAPTFRIFVAASFADYLAAWLTDAAAECAAARALGIDRVAARLA